MTNPQTELPIVEIDGRDWSVEKGALWKAVHSVCDISFHEHGQMNN